MAKITFEELKKIDVMKAFADYRTVKFMKELDSIPEQFHHVFADYCDCGSERIARISLTEIRCCDPKCPIKLGHYMESMLKKSGVKGLGIEISKRLVRYYLNEGEIKSHIGIFLIDPDRYPFSFTDHETRLVNEAITALRSKNYTYASFIQMLSIPEFDSTSQRVFKDVNSTADLAEKIEQEGNLMKFFSNRGVHDPMNSFVFSQFIDDIVEVEAKVFPPMVPVASAVERIVTTGRLYFKGLPIKTEVFIELCNELGEMPDGTRVFSLQDTDAIKSVNYVISEKGYNSTKANQARYREKLEGRKLLYTCDEFYEFLVDLRMSLLGGENSG